MERLDKRIRKLVTERLWKADMREWGRLERASVRTLRILYVAARDSRDDDMTLRAMSFVYTTLLSMVPLLAVSFSVLKAFGVQDQMGPVLAGFLAPLGTMGDELTARIIDFVGNMKVGVLGSIGLATLMYTVISLVAKMEESLNFIWRVKRPRSFYRRFTDYLSVVLVGPILLFSAIGLTSAGKSAALVKGLLTIGPIGAFVFVLGHLMPYITTAAAFAFAYAVIPNTKVRIRAALAGGLFAGVTWEFTGWLFTTFVVKSASYSAIYSGFATVILFMMWLYFSWLIFMVGAAVSFYAQHPSFVTARKLHIAQSGREREKLALYAMYTISAGFMTGATPVTAEALAGNLRIPAQAVRDTLETLESCEFLVKAGDENGPGRGYIPGRDPCGIKIGEILNCVRRRGETPDEDITHGTVLQVDTLLERLEAAMSGAVGDETIRDIVEADAGAKDKSGNVSRLNPRRTPRPGGRAGYSGSGGSSPAP